MSATATAGQSAEGLSGRHALVTGGGTGIGAAIARALSAAGARVTIAGRREAPLRQTAMQLSGGGYVAADVTDEGSVANLIADAERARGSIEILVANAGMAESAAAAQTSLALWSDTIAVNLTGSFLAARAALPAMLARRSGRIVFVASTAGLKGYRYVSAYCAAKHGVVGLMRALAVETARSGVTVNAVCPGFTETDMIAASIDRIVAATGRTPAEARAALERTNPQGRLVRPQEVAAAVLWLVGEGSDAITGQAIAVAGGEI